MTDKELKGLITIRVDADDNKFCSWDCDYFENCHGIRGGAAKALFDIKEHRTPACRKAEQDAKELVEPDAGKEE